MQGDTFCFGYNLARWLKDTLKKAGIEIKDFLHTLRVMPVLAELRVKCL